MNGSVLCEGDIKSYYKSIADNKKNESTAIDKFTPISTFLYKLPLTYFLVTVSGYICISAPCTLAVTHSIQFTSQYYLMPTHGLQHSNNSTLNTHVL